MGELQDLWSTPNEVTSKKFNEFKQGFAKREMVNVKSVIIPKGGQSYNPSTKDHKSLLKQLAIQEEKQVEDTLKKLKTLKPITYGFEVEVTEKGENEVISEESEVDSSEEEIDMDKPLAINKPVNRLDIKSSVQRNKDKAKQLKRETISQTDQKRRFEKDIERIDNLVKQELNQNEYIKRRVMERKKKEVVEIQT